VSQLHFYHMNISRICAHLLLVTTLLASAGVFCRINASEAEPGSASSFPHRPLFRGNHSDVAAFLICQKSGKKKKLLKYQNAPSQAVTWVAHPCGPASPRIHHHLMSSTSLVEPCLTLFFPCNQLVTMVTLRYTNPGEASKTAGLAVH